MASTPTTDFQAIFNVIKTPLLVVAPPDWVIVAVNDARMRVTGQTREETVGRRLFDAFPDDPNDPTADGVQRLSESLRKVVATRSPDRMPVQRYAVSDEHGQFVQRWWDPTNTPLIDGNGEVSLIIHQVEEVSELSRMMLLLESLPGAAYHCQAQSPWRMHYVSAGLQLVTSYSTQDFIKGTVSWGDLIHPDDHAQIDVDVASALERETHFSLHYRIQDPVRGVRWISDAGMGIYTPSGEVESLVGFILDVTEYQNAQVLLREMQAELIHLSRNSAMSTMAATLAHELNQPLAAASNYLAAAQLVFSRGAEKMSVDQALSDVGKNLHRAGEIIKRLRNMTEKTSQAQFGTFNLTEAVQEAIKMVRAAGGDDVAILTPDIRRHSAVGDRIQIEQVLVNLIKNAVEATQTSDRREVRAIIEKTSDKVVVAIEDTGPGVSAEMSEILFQTFASGKKGGMGIGLSICRTIIESHNGKIWLEESPCGGARFCFNLPRREAQN